MGGATVGQGLHLSEPTIMLSCIDAWLGWVNLVGGTHRWFELNRCNWIIRYCQLTSVALLRADALLWLDAFEESSEVREAQYDDRQIVHGLLLHRCRHYFVDGAATRSGNMFKAALVVARGNFHCLCLHAGFINDYLYSILSADTIKDAVTTDQDKVKLFVDIYSEITFVSF